MTDAIETMVAAKSAGQAVRIAKQGDIDLITAVRSFWKALDAERDRAIEWQTFSDNVRVDLAAANERATQIESLSEKRRVAIRKQDKELCAANERADGLVLSLQISRSTLKEERLEYSRCKGDRQAAWAACEVVGKERDAANERATELHETLEASRLRLAELAGEFDGVRQQLGQERKRADNLQRSLDIEIDATGRYLRDLEQANERAEQAAGRAARAEALVDRSHTYGGTAEQRAGVNDLRAEVTRLLADLKDEQHKVTRLKKTVDQAVYLLERCFGLPVEAIAAMGGLKKRLEGGSEPEIICDGCNVRYPHEHRCHEDRPQVRGEHVFGTCSCPDCHPSAEELAAFRQTLEQGEEDHD